MHPYFLSNSGLFSSKLFTTHCLKIKGGFSIKILLPVNFIHSDNSIPSFRTLTLEVCCRNNRKASTIHIVLSSSLKGEICFAISFFYKKTTLRSVGFLQPVTSETFHRYKLYNQSNMVHCLLQQLHLPVVLIVYCVCYMPKKPSLANNLQNSSSKSLPSLLLFIFLGY